MPPRLSVSLSPAKTLSEPFISLNHPLLSLLDSCKSLDQIKQSHAQLITAGFFLHPFPPSKLLQSLLSLPFPITTAAAAASYPLAYADLVFHHTPTPNVFTYNTLIKAHSSPASLLLFRSMLRDPSGPVPNRYTFTSVLGACRPDVLGMAEAEQVRGHALRRGLEANVFVSNVLIRMYGNWGLVDDAKRVFDTSSERDLFSWNLLIGGYVGSGDLCHARDLFDVMPERDVVSWSTVITGYAQGGITGRLPLIV